MTEIVDVARFIGQVHTVTEEQTGRVVTVAVQDGGPCPWWDGRQMLKLTCSFADGKRSNVDTASGAAGQVAGELFRPYSVASLGDDAWGLAVDRQYRDGGPKYGRTSYTFTVFPGPLDRSADIAAITEGLPLEEQLAVISGFYDALRRGEDDPSNDGEVTRVRAEQRQASRG